MKPTRSGNHRARPIDENLNRVIPARASSLLVTFNDYESEKRSKFRNGRACKAASVQTSTVFT